MKGEEPAERVRATGLRSGPGPVSHQLHRSRICLRAFPNKAPGLRTPVLLLDPDKGHLCFRGPTLAHLLLHPTPRVCSLHSQGFMDSQRPHPMFLTRVLALRGPGFPAPRNPTPTSWVCTGLFPGSILLRADHAISASNS